MYEYQVSKLKRQNWRLIRQRKKKSVSVIYIKREREGERDFKTNYNKNNNFVIKILEIKLEVSHPVSQYNEENLITHVVYDNFC